MAQAKEIEAQKAATPPYISFQTVKTLPSTSRSMALRTRSTVSY